MRTQQIFDLQLFPLCLLTAGAPSSHMQVGAPRTIPSSRTLSPELSEHQVQGLGIILKPQDLKASEKSLEAGWREGTQRTPGPKHCGRGQSRLRFRVPDPEAHGARAARRALTWAGGSQALLLSLGGWGSYRAKASLVWYQIPKSNLGPSAVSLLTLDR